MTEQNFPAPGDGGNSGSGNPYQPGGHRGPHPGANPWPDPRRTSDPWSTAEYPSQGAHEPASPEPQAQTRYNYPPLPPRSAAAEWQQPDPPRQRPSRAGLVSVAVAATLLGGAAGVGGAAAYLALDDGRANQAEQPAVSAPVRTTNSDDPAPAGSVEEVAAQVLPSVVKIDGLTPMGSGSGSGIVIGSDGVILTNYHVVDGADSGRARLTVTFNDGKTAPAKVVGTDPLTDLAVIQAEDVSGLPVATLDASDSLDVGEQVVAIGAPFGLQATVTSGIVSALDRPVSAGNQRGFDTIYPAIQTDAAINPGNSGGPLVNMKGEVVGINSSIRTTSSGFGEGGSIGLGFAIPISKVMPIIEQLRNGETATHARLGVSVGTVVSNDGLVRGAEVRSVVDGSAADKAGLRVGDVVTRLDDLIITDHQSLIASIRGLRPGDNVELTVVRDGDEQVLTATLDSDEGTPSS